MVLSCRTGQKTGVTGGYYDEYGTVITERKGALAWRTMKRGWRSASTPNATVA